MKRILILTSLLACNYAIAENNLFKGKGERKEFVIEKIVHFNEKTYAPKAIDFISSASKGNNGPDRKLVSLVSAMRHNDYKWWLSSWDNSSQKKIRLIDKTKELILKRKIFWSKISKGELFFKKWYGFSNYVVISYQIKFKNKIIRKGLVPFRLVNGEWKAVLVNKIIMEKIKENEK